nr:flagellar biosynthesis protein FlhB [Sedimentibacter sp.]
MAGEKTEKASPKKRKDERKKGNVFQSKDVVTVGVIAISFYILKFWMPYIYIVTKTSLIKYISMIETTVTFNDSFISQIFRDIAMSVFGACGVLMIAVIAVTIILTGSQTKFLISADSIKFKFSKLNPLSGIKKMFSIRSVVELIKNLIKIAILGYVVYSAIWKNMYRVPRLMSMDLISGLSFIITTIMSLVNSIIIAFVAISALDFLYQWWEYEKNIKMSKQDVKEEYKQQEGDPQLKGKIKEKQRAISMSRMMQQVPQADVIIRNPTHFAVAIKYDINSNGAPVVLAKGQDNIAMKIIEKAMEYNINLVENKPLARALYKNAEVNMEIPLEFYEPVAEVLAWVYKLKEKGKQ